MRAAHHPVFAIWEHPLRRLPDDERAQIREIIRYATLSPSPHNTQPWLFWVEGRTVRILPDYRRSQPHADPDDRDLFIGLGCLAETLVIAARGAGWESEVTPLPAGERECIRVDLHPADPKPDDPLWRMIPVRHTNRRIYDGRPLPAADQKALAAVPLEVGTHLVLHTEASVRDEVLDLVTAGNRIHLGDPAFKAELVSWIRFNRREAMATGDGLLTAAIGVPSLPGWLGRQLVSRLVLTPEHESRADQRRIGSASGLLSVVSERNDAAAWIATGRSFVRLLLTATRTDLRTAHLNQNWHHPQLKPGLQRALDVGDRHPQVLVRLGYAAPLPHSPRRRLEQVLVAPTDVDALPGPRHP